MVVVGVMVGGALGALSRYGVGLLFRSAMTGPGGASFPLATLVVNVVGSFLLSFAVVAASRGALSPRALVAIGTGFIGAFTTFSTFVLEGDALIQRGLPFWALLSLIAHVVLGYLAVLAGRALALRLGLT